MNSQSLHHKHHLCFIDSPILVPVEQGERLLELIYLIVGKLVRNSYSRHVPHLVSPNCGGTSLVALYNIYHCLIER